MLAVKRSLTQTEKQRYLLDDPGTIYTKNQFMSCMSLKFYEDKLYECQQNLIESRKHDQEVRLLERAKTKSLAKMNGEKHVLKMKYKDLLKTKKDGSDPTFYIQPGFRYRRNGDIKPIKSGISDVKTRLQSNDLPNLVSYTSVASQSAQSLQSGDGVHKSLQDTRNILAKLEHDLRNNKQYYLKTDDDENELVNIDISVRDIEKSLANMRENFQSSSQNQARETEPECDFEQAYRVKSHAACKRFFRQCSRSSCTACESRLKCKKDHLTQKTNNVPLVPWKAAPSGQYVSKPEQTKDKLPRKTLSARPCSRNEQCNEFRDMSLPTISKRCSKSASPIKDSTSNLVRSKRNNATNDGSFVNPILERFIQRQQGRSFTSQHTQSTPKLYESLNINSKDSQENTTESEHVLRVENIDSFRNFPTALNAEPGYKETTEEKIAQFLHKLPMVKPSNSTWRNSKGQLVTWKPYESLGALDSNRSCKTTWRTYRDANPGGSPKHSRMSLQKRDPNSFEELRKCRYLRTRGSDEIEND